MMDAIGYFGSGFILGALAKWIFDYYMNHRRQRKLSRRKYDS